MKRENEPILSVRRLSIGVRAAKNIYTAVDRISFDLNRGEILGIVGESGCGKSITALSLMGLLADGVTVTAGNAWFGTPEDYIDLYALTPRARRGVNGRWISMIYQEPMTCLDPLMKIGRQVGEPLRLHTKKTSAEIDREVLDILAEVGMRDPEGIASSYPHQLSGGQRQRVMIAMACICRPRVLIADEPTTALDVTTQEEILSLIEQLNRRHGTSVILISHDLGVVNRICDRVLVMYAGRIVEAGTVGAILRSPEHPYTRGLLASIPSVAARGSDLPCIPGRVPAVTDQRDACPFAPRCAQADETCRLRHPPRVLRPDGHTVYCHKNVFAARAAAGSEK